MIRLTRRESRTERGTAIVEAVIIFPLIVFLIVMIIDLSNALFHHEVLTQIAREATRKASMIPRLEMGTVRVVDNGGGSYTCQTQPFGGGAVWSACSNSARNTILLDNVWDILRDWELKEQLRVIDGTREIILDRYDEAEPGGATGRRVRARIAFTYDAFFNSGGVFGVLGDRHIGTTLVGEKL